MPRTPDEIAPLLACYAVSPAEQVRQVAHRCALADLWQISPGSEILEIGCGQGDMTAVLADRVGEGGQVIAVDPAPEDYGAPVSLGDSARFLLKGPLRERLEMRFGFDDWETLPHDFDGAVMAHCAWYIRTHAQLVETLSELRSRAVRLHFAEWVRQPKAPSQTAHFVAAVMQTLASAHQPETTRNIRNAYSLEEMRAAIAKAGWRIEREDEIVHPQLDDGKWEVAEALETLAEPLPDEVSTQLKSMAVQLRSYAPPFDSLPCIAFTAV